MIKFFLSRVLGWLASISWKDFLLIVSSAGHAAVIFPKKPGLTPAENAAVNANRAAHVSSVIARTWAGLPTWTVNVIRELAVAWLNRTTA